MNRQLYRCDHDRKIAGVAAGVAEYFEVDVSLVRALWVVSIFFGGFGLLLYLVMAIIVPLEPVSAPRPGWGQAAGPLWGTSPASPVDPATGTGTDADTQAADQQGASAAPGFQGVSGPAPWNAVQHRHPERRGRGFGMTFFGMVLVLFGALALVDQVLPGWADQGRFLWPAFILGLGALLVAMSMRRQANGA